MIENKSFSPILSTLQLYIDSTSLNASDQCLRYYQYHIINGYRVPFLNDHLKFGIIYHSATEAFERAKHQGKNFNESLNIAIDHVLTQTWDPELRRPWSSVEPTKTRDTLLRTTIWYLDTYIDDPLKTVNLPDGRLAVELPFRINLNDIVPDGDFRSFTDEEYSICGYIDRIVEWNGDYWIVDKKTTKSDLSDFYFQNFTPDNQISLYALAGQIFLHKPIAGVIIDAAQVLVTGSRFRRRPIARTEEMLNEWLKDLEFKIRTLERAAQTNHWPQNPKSCGWGNRQCQYRAVCSTDPSMRPELLDAMYVQEVWDPLTPR